MGRIKVKQKMLTCKDCGKLFRPADQWMVCKECIPYAIMKAMTWANLQTRKI